jgi:hypothetical protein
VQRRSHGYIGGALAQCGEFAIGVSLCERRPWTKVERECASAAVGDEFRKALRRLAEREGGSDGD